MAQIQCHEGITTVICTAPLTLTTYLYLLSHKYLVFRGVKVCPAGPEIAELIFLIKNRNRKNMINKTFLKLKYSYVVLGVTFHHHVCHGNYESSYK